MNRMLEHGGWQLNVSPIRPWNSESPTWKVAAGRRQGRPLAILKNKTGKVAEFATPQAAIDEAKRRIDEGTIEDKDTR